MNARIMLLATLFAIVGLSAPAIAQDADTEKGIERYRQMLKEDPWSNPGLLDSDRGETLWTTPAVQATFRWKNAISARGQVSSTALSLSCRNISQMLTG